MNTATEGTASGLDARTGRSALVLGSRAMQALADARILVLGLGGVGGWAAEALARTGARHMTLVDADTVAPSNINRQVMAMGSTVGQSKAEALRHRLLDIAPDGEFTAVEARYTPDTAGQFNLASYDYIIDAIDSLTDKAHLLLQAATLPQSTVMFSSMGAACRLDPSRIATARFDRLKGDALAAALRAKMRKQGVAKLPKVVCVYSDEPRRPNILLSDAATPEPGADGTMAYGKAVVNGALCHITAIFGMTLASLVIGSIAKTHPAV